MNRAIIFLTLAAPGWMAGAQPDFGVRPDAEAVLDRYCFSCHEDGTTKGDVQLDNLASLKPEARLDLLNHVQEQLVLGEMPPKKKKQPSEEERDLLVRWISGELRANNAAKFEEKLRMPDYGNVVDHGKLFSGKYKDLPGSTPDRRWLISEFIFDAKFNKLLDYSAGLDIDGKRQRVLGENGRNGLKANLTNPFLLPTHSGVRYYDTTTLDGGHLLTMITNAKEASACLMQMARTRNYLPAVTAILAVEWEHAKTLAAREAYLTTHVEDLLRELYKERHESLLPAFVPVKPPAPQPSAGPDGKPMKKPVYDTAKPGNEELAIIFAAVLKHGREGVADADMIRECEKDWFHFGVNERAIQLRVNFMTAYMEDLRKRLPKPGNAAPKPPAEAELAVIREALLKHRKAGDTYSAIIAKCLAEWSDGFRREREKMSTTDDAYAQLVDQLFVKILERNPTPQELAEYVALTKSYAEKLGNEMAIGNLMQTLMLRTDFVYRQEFGEGEADEHGRRMLSPRDASYALAYALTDSSPDKELLEAVKNGKLSTREDYRREVERMLKNRSQYYVIDEAVRRIGSNDSFTNMPIRELRFFREFFGYPALLPIFKDNKRFGGDYVTVSGRLVSEADLLVEHILEQDRNVFETLLGTEEFYVFHSGDNQVMAESSAYVRKIYEYFKDKDWENFDAADLKEHVDFLKANEVRGVNVAVVAAGTGGKEVVGGFKITMSSYRDLLGKGQANAVPFSATQGHGKTEGRTRNGQQLRGPEVAKCFNFDLNHWDYPTTQPTRVPHRKGILTHPAWLVAFAGNTATDPIRRGKWVREKLLAGVIPDVPVTVDAVIPEDHTRTMRQRLESKTQAETCWRCHVRMNPLGTTFEMYDDFGRFRTEESLEHPENLITKMPDKGPPQADLRDIYKTLPVDASGRLEGTGDPALDGELRDAIDLAGRLAKSTKVRQSIIRHAFRYFLGRNEVLSDSKTLIDADQAYVQSGGSFDAVILSLLTSDSFIYRTPNPIQP